MRGKTQYSWPPNTSQFSSAPFGIENIIYLFDKTTYLNEEVICTEPTPQLLFLGLALGLIHLKSNLKWRVPEQTVEMKLFVRVVFTKTTNHLKTIYCYIKGLQLLKFKLNSLGAIVIKLVTAVIDTFL